MLNLDTGVVDAGAVFAPGVEGASRLSKGRKRKASKHLTKASKTASATPTASMPIKKTTNKATMLSKKKVNKQGLKWMASQYGKKRERVLEEYLKVAPKGVIKGVINAALNLEQNPAVQLSKTKKRFFAKHRQHISYLTDPKVSFTEKHKAFQTGGFIPLAILAPLITSVVGSLASGFLTKAISGN